jgi:hypothetical protein
MVGSGRSLDRVCWAQVCTCTEACTDPWTCEKLWQCHKLKAGHDNGRNLVYEGSRGQGRHSMPVQPVWKDFE